MVDKVICPKCGSAHIVEDARYDIIDGENHTLKDVWYGLCEDCGAGLQWSEVYRFIGYDEIEEV